MSVHYKFKSALDFDTITFDGLHINVADLKKAIIHQKRLGKNVDFDLQITNAQTKEEYNEDTALIPKNTSLIIARIPLAPNAAKRFQSLAQSKNSVAVTANKAEGDAKHVDLAAMDGSETDKINAMMHQSTADYDPTNYQKVRGGGQIGEVPPTYRCHRCHKPGHWIKNCPLGPIQRDMPEVKRSTGIPRSFIERDKNATVEKTPAVIPEMPKTEVPEDLICSICKDLFTDAVMIPCCGSSFCDECVRTALLESEENECPDCQEKGTSPASLIPNRFLRRSVNNFKNETGYIVPKKQKVDRTQETEEAIQDSNTEPNEVTETEQVEQREDYSENTDHMSQESESEKMKEEHRKTGEDSYLMDMHAISSNPQESQHYHDSEDYNITTDLYHRSESGHEQSNESRSGPIPPYNMQQIHGYHNQPYPHSGGAPQHMNQNFMMRPYNQHGYGRPPYIQQRGYGHGGYPQRNRHIAPYPDVNTIYQGVAQQVGTGIIDDPLEAFNRIMREKERAKEEQARRRSPGFINKYRRSRTPDRRRKRRSNSFEGSPKRFDRRPIDRKRRRSRSFSSSRSRTRSPVRKRSFTPRKYSKSPIRRSRSISQHNRQQHRSQRRGDYRESSDRGGAARKDNDNKKSPVSSSRSKYKDSRHRSKTRDMRKKSRSRSPNRATGKNNKPTGEKEKDRPRRRSKERSPYHDASIKHIPPSKANYTNNVNNAFPLEFNDVLPPGVEAFDDESWQTNEKYVINKAPNCEKAERSENQTIVKHPSSELTGQKQQEHENDESKSAKDRKVNKDKKRRKKETEKEKDVHGKKSKKHKREKSDRDGSHENSKVDSLEHAESKIKETIDSDVKPKDVTETIKTNENDKTLTPPLSTITKSDSVLDLYDNIDLDIFGDQSLNQSDDFLALPEPSKWEVDEKPTDSGLESKRRETDSREQSASKNMNTDKPYGKDSSPILSAIVRPSSDSTVSTSVHNLKISVPAKSTNHSERSIELKSTSKHDKMKSVVSNDGKESKKPSIKDRLGEKIKEKSSDRRPTDPGRSSGSSSKLASAALRNDNGKNERERDRGRSKSSRSHQQSGSHQNSDKAENRSSRPRSPFTHKKTAVPSSKSSKSRASSTSSSSSSESNEGEMRTKRSNKKEKKSKKKRSGSKSSDNDSNTSIDKKKKSSKKKSKKEKKKKREKEKNKS
ncbi:E3 ubiquitin-protein ligase RBBP6 isoform X2 [Culicoides brevitarsis]|uniref:E3 ubiquitin-protein ligase RBBP6 isoform X2 n=1 Tax=Culicoides brevitarsis TaxID=469753 RepID=UPI00307C1735